MEVMLPCPGGVMVMVCPVNSSSKYLVSVSEVTWGLNGGTSCWRGDKLTSADQSHLIVCSFQAILLSSNQSK